jgi:hypothetical protein
MKKLRSIEFQHAAMFLPFNLQNKIMYELKLIAINVENNNLTEEYPIEIPTIRKGIVFIITEKDASFIVRLSKLFESFSSFYDKFLQKIQNYNQNFIRYLYFVSGNERRLPKSIHYTKNVYSIFTHDALHYESSSIILNASIDNGHLNNHFRDELNIFFYKYQNFSIKTINYDFEYLFYLLKTHTNYCNVSNSE